MTGKAILSAIPREPLVDIIIRGMVATSSAVMIAAIFNEAVEDAILS